MTGSLKFDLQKIGTNDLHTFVVLQEHLSCIDVYQNFRYVLNVLSVINYTPKSKVLMCSPCRL